MTLTTACPHCGKPVTDRSGPDHRRFFGLIAKAFDQWPEQHTFQPDNAEHLRAWLICKAGYRESTFLELPDGTTPSMQGLFALCIEGAIKAADGVGFVVPYKDGVAVIKPRSIAWGKLDQKAFGALREAVEGVLKAEIGFKLNADVS